MKLSRMSNWIKWYNVYWYSVL